MAAYLRLTVTLVTGRTIEQGVGKEQGKNSNEYFESAAVCYIDSEDMKKLGIKQGVNVQISTEYGRVILKSLKSPRGPHAGVIFVPYGPWANVVASSETDSIGMPSLKGVPAEIAAAPDEAVESLSGLLKKEFGKD
jgi:formylmethanofuran dehydrogenase subunit D